MYQKAVSVPNRLGVHARPAALIVKKAAVFTSEITISNGIEEVNGKSIMGVMTLAAGQGRSLISASGEDEEKAVDELCNLVSSGFGED